MHAHRFYLHRYFPLEPSHHQCRHLGLSKEARHRNATMLAALRAPVFWTILCYGITFIF